LAQAQTKWTFNPTKRGGGGIVKTLWWQAPTLLNPHFANGTKDQDASRVFYEPLGAYDPDGNIRPGAAAGGAESPERTGGEGRIIRDLAPEEERRCGMTATPFTAT